MARLVRALQRFEDHWLADLLAVVGLFTLPVLMLFAGLVFGEGR